MRKLNPFFPNCTEDRYSSRIIVLQYRYYDQWSLHGIKPIKIQALLTLNSGHHTPSTKNESYASPLYAPCCAGDTCPCSTRIPQ